MDDALFLCMVLCDGAKRIMLRTRTLRCNAILGARQIFVRRLKIPLVFVCMFVCVCVCFYAAQQITKDAHTHHIHCNLASPALVRIMPYTICDKVLSAYTIYRRSSAQRRDDAKDNHKIGNAPKLHSRCGSQKCTVQKHRRTASRKYIHFTACDLCVESRG